MKDVKLGTFVKLGTPLMECANDPQKREGYFHVQWNYGITETYVSGPYSEFLNVKEHVHYVPVRVIKSRDLGKYYEIIASYQMEWRTSRKGSLRCSLFVCPDALYNVSIVHGSFVVSPYEHKELPASACFGKDSTVSENANKETNPSDSLKCTCPYETWMTVGCKCGAMEAERANRQGNQK